LNNNIRPETDVTGERKKEEKKGGENSIYQKIKKKAKFDTIQVS